MAAPTRVSRMREANHTLTVSFEVEIIQRKRPACPVRQIHADGPGLHLRQARGNDTGDALRADRLGQIVAGARIKTTLAIVGEDHAG